MHRGDGPVKTQEGAGSLCEVADPIELGTLGPNENGRSATDESQDAGAGLWLREGSVVVATLGWCTKVRHTDGWIDFVDTGGASTAGCVKQAAGGHLG